MQRHPCHYDSYVGNESHVACPTRVFRFGGRATICYSVFNKLNFIFMIFLDFSWLRGGKMKLFQKIIKKSNNSPSENTTLVCDFSLRFQRFIHSFKTFVQTLLHTFELKSRLQGFFQTNHLEISIKKNTIIPRNIIAWLRNCFYTYYRNSYRHYISRNLSENIFSNSKQMG